MVWKPRLSRRRPRVPVAAALARKRLPPPAVHPPPLPQLAGLDERGRGRVCHAAQHVLRRSVWRAVGVHDDWRRRQAQAQRRRPPPIVRSDAVRNRGDLQGDEATAMVAGAHTLGGVERAGRDGAGERQIARRRLCATSAGLPARNGGAAARPRRAVELVALGA
eukprot:5205543-Prymnesium_polylepis.1